MSLPATAGLVLLALLLIAGSLAPFLLWMVVSLFELALDRELRPGWVGWVGSSVLAFACIVLGVWMLSNAPSDEASHCGPGTRYVSQDHLVGKTIVHDWVCVA